MRGLTICLALLVPLAAIGATKKVETQKIVVGEPTPPAAPEIHHGIEDLPAKVQATRKRILDAAYSGDMQKLKVVLQQNETPPILSVNETGDPIDYLKTQSGDGAGLEILAILTDILEAGWTRVDVGKPGEMYVWPYFVSQPMDKLSPEQKVELFKIVTSGDFEDMKIDGKYKFYSVGIGPDGTWHFFKINE